MELKFVTGADRGGYFGRMTAANSQTGPAVPLEVSAVETLASNLRGKLIRPGDRTYDEHRGVWNGSIDRHPALIARCAGVADVIEALRFGLAPHEGRTGSS